MGVGYVLDEELSAFLETGVSIIVATRDERLAPDITRAMALRVDGPSLVSLVLSQRSASVCLANAQQNGALAVCVADPVGYRSVQLKGRCVGIEPTDLDALARSERWRDLFAQRCAPFGILPTHVRNLWLESDRVLHLEVREAYAQTPGSGAGAALPEKYPK